MHINIHNIATVCAVIWTKKRNDDCNGEPNFSSSTQKPLVLAITAAYHAKLSQGDSSVTLGRANDTQELQDPSACFTFFCVGTFWILVNCGRNAVVNQMSLIKNKQKPIVSFPTAFKQPLDTKAVRHLPSKFHHLFCYFKAENALPTVMVN